MPINLSTRDLRAFIALADQRSFTRAARQSSLSQPAFSALIRSIEEQLGTRLFDRDTRNVELTHEGRVFEQSARRLLDDFVAALDDVRDLATHRKGRVAMAVLPSLAAGWLPGVLAEFRAVHPGIEIDVADVLSEACIARVRAGSADFALAATQADTPELRADAFCSDGFFLVCRRDHPLAAARQLRLKDLAAHPFIAMTRNSSVRQSLDAAVTPLQMNAVMEVEQLATVMGMVRAGLGISVVPALTLFQFQHDEVVTRALALPGMTRRMFMIRRRDRSLSAAAQALHDLVMKRRPRGVVRGRRQAAAP
jgi:DNA-binding transcriptional LysR family regulator